MRIIYDHHMFTIQRFGGISRIFIELMRELSKYPECSLDWYRGWHKDGYEVEDFSNRLRRYWSFPGGDRPRLNALGWRIFNLTALGGYDLYHPTYYDTNLLPVVKYQKLVITVHDLILEKFLFNLERFKGQIQAKKQLIEQADLIFVASENTKKDLLETFRVDQQQIIWTPWATRIEEITPTPIPELNTDRPYFLYVGTRSKYKNFNILIEAFAQSNWLAENFRVICFGGTSDFTREEQQKIAEHNLLDNFSYLAGDDSVLKTLYQNAQALVYTSRYEGFGLPPLEAMSCNCPVVCCPTSSLPEVVGDTAVFFDSDSVEELILALTTVVQDQARRHDLLAKGQERAKLFSWQKTAKLTLQGYQQVLS